jgi:tetratricopeptide (TPR) repeat protein
MAAKITNLTELFHRFHACEMQLKQGKIAACLIAFREVIEKMTAIPKTEKEKKELHEGIELFLRGLSAHKKFQDIFGVVSFGDSNLETNLEFIKSMIVAQEEDILERIKKDEAALEAQRLEIDLEKQRRQEEIRQKIEQVIILLDSGDQPAAMEILSETEEIREAVELHYNDAGMQCRTNKAYDEAISNYAKALIVSPQDENLFYNMGRAHFEAGHPDKAEQRLADALRLNPDFKEGEIFYDYLLKLNRPIQANPAPESKSGGFLKKIFGK